MTCRPVLTTWGSRKGVRSLCMQYLLPIMWLRLWWKPDTCCQHNFFICACGLLWVCSEGPAGNDPAGCTVYTVIITVQLPLDWVGCKAGGLNLSGLVAKRKHLFLICICSHSCSPTPIGIEQPFQKKAGSAALKDASLYALLTCLCDGRSGLQDVQVPQLFGFYSVWCWKIDGALTMWWG